jgi:hypothetical protein
VKARLRALAVRVGVLDETAQRLVDLAISDACRQQERLEDADERRRIALDSNQGTPVADESMMSFLGRSSAGLARCTQRRGASCRMTRRVDRVNTPDDAWPFALS